MGIKISSECIFRYAFKDAFVHPEDLSQFYLYGVTVTYSDRPTLPISVEYVFRLKLFFILRA
jgi:hypothetical protein